MVESFRSFDAGAAVVAASHARPAAAPPQGRSWADVLGLTIESEILPRLLSSRCGGPSAAEPGTLPSAAEVSAFLALIIADEIGPARAMAGRLIEQFGRDVLLHDVLTPAARRLGEMWEQDLCDFMTVTLGVYRLDQIMKETATAGHDRYVQRHNDHRILLVPAPGEQHSFGLGMVADMFRADGWSVRSGPAVSRQQLTRLVRAAWYDVIALSISAERALNGLASCIRAVRQASQNKQAFIMVGGRAVTNHFERARFLGADAAPRDAQNALAEANIFVETTMTETLRQCSTALVDRG